MPFLGSIENLTTSEKDAGFSSGLEFTFRLLNFLFLGLSKSYIYENISAFKMFIKVLYTYSLKNSLLSFNLASLRKK